ncbi:MAG: YciI family protein [Amylibacter sp.]
MIQEWKDVTDTYVKDGVMVSGNALQPVEAATSLRLRDGKLETMDGPFAETKGHLGGYYLLECKDLDEAIKYAAMIPTARDGTVEVRPILDVGLHMAAVENVHDALNGGLQISMAAFFLL